MSETGSNWNNAALDAPESAPDVLGRSSLAAMLAQGLLRSRPNESLVTAIYGSWGSGKSWLKHRILKELEAQQDAVTVVEFTPWQIRGVDELTIQFFAQIHAHLTPDVRPDAEERLTKRKRMWMALARLSGAGAAALKVVGGAGAFSEHGALFAPALMAAAGVSEEFAKLLQNSADDVGAKAENLSSPATAEEARKELAKLFSEPDAPNLLVVMDDFDRLTNEEIQTLIRLIKANANFPGLNYLIFCDPDHLAAALDPIAAKRGKEFLEKIVQNPIRLPQPDSDSLLKQLINGLEGISERTLYRLEQHGSRLGIYFHNFLRVKLRNLRSVYRLIEALDFSAAALTRDGRLEVDLIDLLAVEFLRLHVPALADWLQEFRPSFHVATGLRALFDDDKKGSFKDLLPESAIQSFGAENCYTAVRTLFPQIAPDFPADEANFKRSLALEEKIPKDYALPLSEEEHFDAYFRLQPHPLKIPESAYLAVLSDQLSRAEVRQHLEGWISKGWLLSALRRLAVDAKTFSSNSKRKFFLAFADCADLMGRSEELGVFEESELRKGLWYSEELLDAFPEQEREPALDELFESVEAITARMLFLEGLRIRQSPGSFEGREPRAELPVWAPEKLDELRTALARAANSAIRNRDYFDHPQQGLRLWRWVNSVGVEHTQAFMRECLDRGESVVLLKLLRCIARSEVGRFAMSFEDPTAYTGSTSRGLFKTLLRFASRDFWQAFVAAVEDQFPETDSPALGDHCLIQHVRRAFREAE